MVQDKNVKFVVNVALEERVIEIKRILPLGSRNDVISKYHGKLLLGFWYFLSESRSIPFCLMVRKERSGWGHQMFFSFILRGTLIFIVNLIKICFPDTVEDQIITQVLNIYPDDGARRKAREVNRSLCFTLWGTWTSTASLGLIWIVVVEISF